MSGHSKWSTIKRKKGANDAKRGKLFAKLIRGIEVAAKNGGTDPNNNAALYQAISKAKSNSVPNSNIDNALKRMSGDSSTESFDEITYEGYGPNGVAILVECVTDNRNRTPGPGQYLSHSKSANGVTMQGRYGSVMDAGKGMKPGPG